MKDKKLIFPKWNIEAETGYKPKTTFWMDFSIADEFGIEGVKDTFNRAFNEWKNNIEYITELAIVTNWKCWDWYKKNDEIARLYADYYYQCRNHVYDDNSPFDEKEREYYFRNTD